MRRLALLLLVLGCHTSDYNSGKKTPDGGGNGGDGGRTIADASVSIDAPPAAGKVVVTINPTSSLGRLGGYRVVNQTIVIHAPDGSVATELAADPSGTTTADVKRGDMVTVATQYACAGDFNCTRYSLYTVTNVNPGDTLTVGPPPPPAQTNVTTTVNFPGNYGPDGGLPSYWADLGSGFNWGGQDATQPLLTTAYLVGSDNQVHALGWAQDQNGTYLASAGGSSAALDGGIAVTLGSWVSAPSITYNLTDAPANASSVQLSGFLLAKGVPLTLPSVYQSITPGASATFTSPVDTNGLDGSDLTVSVTENASTFQTVQAIEKRDAVPTAPVAIDLAATILPPILYAAPEIESTGKAAVRWAIGGTFTGDAIQAQVNWVIPSGVNTSGDWTVWMPSDATPPFVFPALPTDLDPNFTPPADSTTYNNPAFIELWDASFANGWDTFKNVFDTSAFFTTTGTILISTLQQPG